MHPDRDFSVNAGIQLSQGHRAPLVCVIRSRFGTEVDSGKRQKVRCKMTNPPDRGFSEIRFLTVAEVAAVMRVSKMTVYRLVHAGELPAVRVGRSFRVPEQAVHDYLRDSFVETA